MKSDLLAAAILHILGLQYQKYIRISAVSSVWFKLFLYSLTKCGPPSILLTKGTRLRILPKVFRDHEKLLVTTWSHDASTVPMSNALPILNDALCHSAVLVQGQGNIAEFHYLPFPIQDHENSDKGSESIWDHHFALKVLAEELDLINNCGYVTMMKICSNGPSVKYQGNSSYSIKHTHEGSLEYSSLMASNGNTVKDQSDLSSQFTLSFSGSSSRNTQSSSDVEKDWIVLDCSFGIPLFNGHLNKKVCQRLLEQKFYNQDSLKKLTASNRKLCLSLLQFISEFQPVIPNSDVGRITAFPPNRPGCDIELPLPTENLLFYNGKLTIWDQK